MLDVDIRELKLEIANHVEHRALAFGFIAAYDIPKSEQSGERITCSCPITNMDALPRGHAVEAIVYEATAELWRRLTMHAPPARIDASRLSHQDVLSWILDSNHNMIVSPDIGAFLTVHGYRFLSDFPGYCTQMFGLGDVAVSGNDGGKYIVRDRFSHVSYMLEVVERGRFVIDEIEGRTVEFSEYLDIKVDIQWPRLRRLEFENLNLLGA